MLSDEEQQRIASAFAVYEHEWPFLAGYLGEPFLIEDCIVYWDGQVTSVSAFPLNQANATLTAETLGAMVSTLPAHRPVELVHVWATSLSPTLFGRADGDSSWWTRRR